MLDLRSQLLPSRLLLPFFLPFLAPPTDYFPSFEKKTESTLLTRIFSTTSKRGKGRAKKIAALIKHAQQQQKIILSLPISDSTVHLFLFLVVNFFESSLQLPLLPTLIPPSQQIPWAYGSSEYPIAILCSPLPKDQKYAFNPQRTYCWDYFSALRKIILWIWCFPSAFKFSSWRSSCNSLFTALPYFNFDIRRCWARESFPLDSTPLARMWTHP